MNRTEPTLEILTPGPLATIQDLGRPGLAALGVPRSGAADRTSLRLANRLVGNAEGAAALELTFGGLRARLCAAGTAALTGAPCPATVNGRAVGMNAPIPLPAGAILDIGAPTRGARTYLAVRGGIDVPQVLGARSTDILSGLGPQPLNPGAVLPIGAWTTGFPTVDQAPVRAAKPEHPYAVTGSGTTLRITPGPRTDWFTPEALELLCTNPYLVTPESNRVGARLDGPLLRRAPHRENAQLPPEGMVRGALQIPPHGRPVLLLADHPVTGGYPVIAVVLDEDVDHAAQLRPGDQVRFRTVSLAAPQAGRAPSARYSSPAAP